MNTTTEWICDTCGEAIISADDGWVEWLGEDDQERGLRLVHAGQAGPRKVAPGCQYDEQEEHTRRGAIVKDGSLSHYLGTDGLTRLLSFLAIGRLPQAEVIEMIQRLHVAGYERAHRYFRRAASEIETNLPEGFHWQRDLARISELAEDQGW